MMFLLKNGPIRLKSADHHDLIVCYGVKKTLY